MPSSSLQMANPRLFVKNEVALCLIINQLILVLQLCNLFCCQPPDVKLSGKLSSALRLFLPWMSPELMKTRLTSYVRSLSLSLSSLLHSHTAYLKTQIHAHSSPYIQDNDVYSLGVLLWEVWSGVCPWPDLSPPQLGKVLVEEGQRLPITKSHFVISHILDSCFGPPVDRLPAEEFLCQMGYLKTTPL